MARLTNVSGEDREVPLLGNQVVPAGATVDVDDALLAEFVWPESTWKVETTKGKAKAGEELPG